MIASNERPRLPPGIVLDANPACLEALATQPPAAEIMNTKTIELTLSLTSSSTSSLRKEVVQLIDMQPRRGTFTASASRMPQAPALSPRARAKIQQT